MCRESDGGRDSAIVRDSKHDSKHDSSPSGQTKGSDDQAKGSDGKAKSSDGKVKSSDGKAKSSDGEVKSPSNKESIRRITIEAPQPIHASPTSGRVRNI